MWQGVLQVNLAYFSSAILEVIVYCSVEGVLAADTFPLNLDVGFPVELVSFHN